MIKFIISIPTYVPFEGLSLTPYPEEQMELIRPVFQKRSGIFYSGMSHA
jgi:hypothetical protein